jgi:transposase-like protein
VPVLQRNAQAYVPAKALQPQVAQDIRDFFNAPNGQLARTRLHEEINRRTRVARLLPNEASLLRWSGRLK